jgi:predicted transcriptional regulator
MARMAEERTRVDFNAPRSLVERADTVAELLDISRTQLLVEALRDELDARLSDTQFQREIKQAYYDGRIEFETVETALGTEEALRVKLLRESITRDAPEPHLEGDLPPQDAFYEGDEPLPEWMPDEPEESDDPSAS